MDHQTQSYLEYYNTQTGGQLPVFHGARRMQSGSGLGDILRGLFRTVFPIAAHGLGTFLNEAVRRKDAGNSWKDAAKGAIGPTAETVATRAVTAVTNGINSTPQSGKGRKRKQPRRNAKKRGHANRRGGLRSQNAPQFGGGGKKKRSRAAKAGYKRLKKKGMKPRESFKFLNF